MSGLAILTRVHTAISLIGIGTGLVVLWGFLRGRTLPQWTVVFLAASVLTSVTGFLFPFHRLLPSHVVGLASLGVLAVVLWSRYATPMEGRWALSYVIGAVFALLFSKVPPLHVLAPTQTEPPFAVAQVVVLALFVVLGTRAVRMTRAVVARSAL